MSQIEIESFAQRIRRFRHVQTITELSTALKCSGLFCIFCRKVSDLHWVKTRLIYETPPDENPAPSAIRLCGRCATNYNVGWDYTESSLKGEKQTQSFKETLDTAHEKRLKQPHRHYWQQWKLR